MFTAQSSNVPDENGRPLSSEEIWDFCAKGFTRG
jgi:hypothetical protein